MSFKVIDIRWKKSGFDKIWKKIQVQSPRHIWNPKFKIIVDYYFIFRRSWESFQKFFLSVLIQIIIIIHNQTADELIYYLIKKKLEKRRLF